MDHPCYRMMVRYCFDRMTLANDRLTLKDVDAVGGQGHEKHGG